jgi:uncharacterized protein YecE (DUF72 family)
LKHESIAKRHVFVGLSGWGDHDRIYPPGTKAGDKLGEYSKCFPIVELDASFYAVPSPDRMRKWSEQAPESFGFIVKAYQGMTGHARGKIPFEDAKSMFRTFREAAAEMQKMGKLNAVLFQYPPWFTCERKNVDILRRTREWMDGFPLALEFRHQSWFDGEMRDKTLSFMREEGWIHSVCDEPQAGEGSIPAIIEPTQEDVTLVRLHGRNISGWHSSGQPNWREVRYLYRYDENELLEWKHHINKLLESTRNCWVIFNNNSGGDAADNAMQLMKLMNLEMPKLPPDQLSLFEE